MISSIPGERVGLAITLFLSMTVFMLIVDSLMPETSDTVPILIIFFGVSFMEMVCIIIATCIILKMHSADYPLPSLVRRLLYDNWSFKVGIRSKKQAKVNPISDGGANGDIRKTSDMTNGKLNDGYFHSENNEGVKKLSLVKLVKGADQQSPSHATRPTTTNPNQLRPSSAGNVQQLFTDELTRKVGLIVERLASDEESDRIKEEWKVCAYTLDRIMLVSFLFFFTVTVLCCFVTASVKGETD